MEPTGLHAPFNLWNYHPFQNHYTHEITIFELFRGLQFTDFGGLPN